MAQRLAYPGAASGEGSLGAEIPRLRGGLESRAKNFDLLLWGWGSRRNHLRTEPHGWKVRDSVIVSAHFYVYLLLKNLCMTTMRLGV